MASSDKPLHKILVPVDFSETSLEALPLAARLANAPNMELHLLHVHPPIMTYAQTGGTLPPVPAEVGVPTAAELKEKLEEVEVSDAISPAQVKRVVVEGEPAAAILDYAAREGIDLIVLTTHGHTGLSRLLMGSVAEHVVRKSECPVLTFKAPNAAT